MTSSPVIPGLVAGRPLEVSTLTVAKSQVNKVGHLRASEYVKLFDDANTAFYVHTGLADENLVHDGTTSFLMDLHTCYLAELRAGETVHIGAQVLEVDARRVHLIYQMTTAADGRLAATCELAIINMNMATRRPAPWSAVQQEIWKALTAAHGDMPKPPQSGRSIGNLAAKT